MLNTDLAVYEWAFDFRERFEGYHPAEFSSNPNQTRLIQLIKVSMV